MSKSKAAPPGGTAVAKIPEKILLGLGNPLLDITVRVDDAFLKKYGLIANNAIIADERHDGIFKEILDDKYEREYVAGGATQNTIRVAQWLLGRQNATTFVGAIGADENGKILTKKAKEVGVNVCYQIRERFKTGICAALIHKQDRSLVTELGAATTFTDKFFDDATVWQQVEQAQFYYIGGFVFTVSEDAILKIARHSTEKGKTLIMNLSAPFLCYYFKDPEISIMEHIDILVGNEVEAATFAHKYGFETDDLKEIAIKAAELPKKNTKRKRTVIFTHGRHPAVVYHDGKVFEHPSLKIDPSEIKDTNGCGDSFLGGFLSQLVQGKPIEECLRCANYAASVVIKYYGCNYPEKPDFK
ncbi:uncharacterized protein LOC141906521 isoform X2 [Tubulanus polymorphus]